MKDDFRFCPVCAKEMALTSRGGEPRLGCPACGYIHYFNPAPAAGVLISDGEGRILLAQRRDEPFAGLWTIPSGFVEYDEDIRLTAVRELGEEAGLEVELDGIHAVESCMDDPRGNTLLVVFRGHVTGGGLKAGDDASDVAFFSLDELPEIAFDCQKRIISRLKTAQGTDRF
ncbi:MAG TPA: NUDIX hydrolase [Candidatus Krumholzibacterium sp.]|nr:NUDIX hydrolase [Candidatus Krumholzibacterium sp.]